MFVIDPKISDKELKEKDIFKALFSMNTHQVANPEMGLEEARSYVFFFREGKQRLSAYIGLHLLHTDRKLFYTQSANPFSVDKAQEIEDEARNFAEDLGAMLDEKDLSSMSDPEKQLWISEQDIFKQKKAPDAVPSEPLAAPTEVSPQSSSALVQPASAEQPAPLAQPSPPMRAAPVPQAPPAQPAAHPPTAPISPPVQAIPEPPPAPVPPSREVAMPAAAPAASEPYSEAPKPRKVRAVSPPSSKPRTPAEKQQQDIMQLAIEAGIAKPPKQALKMEPSSSSGVVSRDREALARLLTSF